MQNFFPVGELPPAIKDRVARVQARWSNAQRLRRLCAANRRDRPKVFAIGVLDGRVRH
jgi:hypothetical protein